MKAKEQASYCPTMTQFLADSLIREVNGVSRPGLPCVPRSREQRYGLIAYLTRELLPPVQIDKAQLAPAVVDKPKRKGGRRG